MYPSETVPSLVSRNFLENLMTNTRKTYLDTLSQYLSVLDEKAVIKVKKDCTGRKELI